MHLRAMSQYDGGGVSYAGVAIASLLTASILGVAIQRRYLSSISDIPGPFVASFSILWQVWSLIRGHTQEDTFDLHKQHGK